ncbi:MAG: BatD family protein, partial [Candidatus Eiseniibacteriota bacterium]
IGLGGLGALALAAIVPAARAAELAFSASVEQTTVGLGEQFEMVLSVQGEDMLSVPSPVLPPLPDFDVLGRSSSQSTNISIIGGQMRKQATVSFIYALAAKRLGKSLIPPCKLVYQGKEYLSQPIEITVVQAAQGRATPTPGPSGVSPPRGQVPLEGNLFLSVVPSRRTAYVGEPITVEILLCSRFQITDGGWAALPAFDGFWAEKVFDADRFDFQTRVIDGKQYGVSVLKKVALFPLSPGRATIKPMAFNVAIARAPRDIFEFFGGSQAVKVESKPLTLDILPLPEKGRPAEFTGGVGRFALDASLDRATTTHSEPVNLTVRISGSGNLRMIDKPVVPPIVGLRILEPEIKDDVRVAGAAARGTKTFRYPIIPQSDGRYVIAPIAVAYFDPQDKAYKTMRTGPLEFAASGSAVGAPLVEPTGLKVLGTDIGYIKPDATALRIMPMALPWWPNLLYVVSLGMMGSALWYRAHSERLLSDRGYARKTRSSALVRRRLRDAERLLKKNDQKGFHAALAQAVMGYVGDRFNIDSHAMTKDQLRGEMDRLQVAGETSAALIEIVDLCEIARFSPETGGASDPRRLLERARDVLGRV